MEDSYKFYSYQKVIIFGAEGTGKTSLIKSFNCKFLEEDNYNFFCSNKDERKFNLFYFF